MKSLRCLRGQQARIPRCLPPRIATAVSPASGARACPQPFWGVPVRSFSRTVRAADESKNDADAQPLENSNFRRERLADLQSGEEGLFQETFPRLEHRTETMSVSDFLAAHGEAETPEQEAPGKTPEEVTLYGRIRSLRRHGKYLVFIDIVNQFHAIQAMVNWSKVSEASPITKRQYRLFARMLERGDHISVTGRAARTSTGQLSIEATRVPELLAPALDPVPEVLTEPDKVRRRHLDMIVNPGVTETLRLRAAIISYIRKFLNDRQFLEFQTPIIADNAGGAVARPFMTASTEVPSKELALRIAPELWLKRLVVGGVHNVYEIGPSFRNESIDGTHNPEFTMCEFYSAYTNLRDLVRRTEELVSGLALHCQELISSQLKHLPPIDTKLFAAPFRTVEFVPALEKMLGFHLPNLAAESALADMITVLQLAEVNIPGGTPTSLPKLLDRLAAIYIEPLSMEGPLFVTHHPSCMSPLSKSFMCPKTGQEVSARAELFVQGRELANMYEEENNPDLQLRKMVEYRRRAERPTPSIVDDCVEEAPEREPEEGEGEEEEAPTVDLSYIQALRTGLPPTGGWGCGIERLVMMFSGSRRISDCLSFGTLKNVVSLNTGDDVRAEPKLGGRSRLEQLNRRILEKESSGG